MAPHLGGGNDMAPQEMNSPPSEGAQKEDFLRFYKVSSCRARAEDVMLAAGKIGPPAAHLGGGDDMAPHLGGDDMGGGERQTQPWYPHRGLICISYPITHLR